MRFVFSLFLSLLIHSLPCLAQSNSTSVTLKNKVLNRSPFIGAEIGTLTNPIRVAYKMKVEKGIIIYKIFPNSASDKAGLLEKDVIIAIDSTHLNNLKELQDFINTREGYDTLNVFFVRNDTVKNTPLILQFLPRETNFYFETMYDQIEIEDSTQINNQTSLRTIITFPRNNDNNKETNQDNNSKPKNQTITQFPLVLILNSASNQSIERELYAKKKNTKNEYQFYDWIENLTKNGFATLRIEKKGVGDSNGNLSEWTFKDEQKSIDAALEKTKKYGSINQQKIYLVALGSSSLVALENYRINLNKRNLKKSDSLNKIDFQRIFIEKLPADLQKTKNQNADSLLILLPHLVFFSKKYPRQVVFNLKEYNLFLESQKIFWIESQDDILRVIRELKDDMEEKQRKK